MSEDIQADLPAGASEEQSVEASIEQQENPDHEKAITDLADEAIHAVEANSQSSQEPVKSEVTQQTEKPQELVDDGDPTETPAEPGPVFEQEEQVLDLDEQSFPSASKQNPENSNTTVESSIEKSVEKEATDDSELVSEEPDEHSTPVHEYFNLNPDQFGAMPTAEFIRHADEYIQINIDLEQAKRTVEELEKRKKQLQEEALNYGEHTSEPVAKTEIERSDVDHPNISPAEQIGEAVPSL